MRNNSNVISLNQYKVLHNKKEYGKTFNFLDYQITLSKTGEKIPIRDIIVIGSTIISFVGFICYSIYKSNKKKKTK